MSKILASCNLSTLSRSPLMKRWIYKHKKNRWGGECYFYLNLVEVGVVCTERQLESNYTNYNHYPNNTKTKNNLHSTLKAQFFGQPCTITKLWVF